MRSLLWKEWREQGWKLAFGCLLMGAFALIGLRTRMAADVVVVTGVCFLGILLLPMMAAAGLVPAERAEGTLASLLALPVTPRKVLAAKTAMGAALCVLPFLTAMVVALAVAAGREMSAATIVGLHGRSLAATLSLFVWMLALTIYLPSEARAGLICLGVLIFWILATFGLAAAGPAARLTPASLGIVCPFIFNVGLVADPTIARNASIHPLLGPRVVPMAWALATQGTIACGLWIWAAGQIARPSKEER